MNSTVRVYKTFTVESSISASTSQKSITEEPTRPEMKAQGKVTRRLSRIDEITTIPPSNEHHSEATYRSLVPVPSQLDVTAFQRSNQAGMQVVQPSEVEAVSWTAGEAAHSTHAQLISSRSRRKSHH